MSMPTPQSGSIEQLWSRFLNAAKADQLDFSDRPDKPVDAVRFGDNEVDVNECLHWVVIGQKRATSPSLWSIEAGLDHHPQVGDLNVVIDWQGVACCVIQTQAVERRRFADVDEAYAWLEGEGDRSLAYWQRVHEAYYRRELAGTGVAFDPKMELILETFSCLWVDPGYARR